MIISKNNKMKFKKLFRILFNKKYKTKIRLNIFIKILN